MISAQMLWIVLLASYSIGMTAILMLLRARQQSPSRRALGAVLRRHVAVLNDASIDRDALDRLKIAIEVEKLYNEDSPWYERSISVIGVVAFFSMLIATGVQTLNASLQAGTVERLKTELATLDSVRNDLDSILKDTTQTLLASTAPLDVVSGHLLRHRLRLLKSVGPVSDVQLREQLDIAMRLDDFDEAIRLIESHPELLKESVPEDRLRLAEYRYISGTPLAAKALLEEVLPVLTQLAQSARIRALVLRAQVAPRGDSDVFDLAGVMRVSPSEAAKYLQSRLQTLKSRTGAAHISLDSAR